MICAFSSSIGRLHSCMVSAAAGAGQMASIIAAAIPVPVRWGIELIAMLFRPFCGGDLGRLRALSQQIDDSRVILS